MEHGTYTFGNMTESKHSMYTGTVDVSVHSDTTCTQGPSMSVYTATCTQGPSKLVYTATRCEQNVSNKKVRTKLSQAWLVTLPVKLIVSTCYWGYVNCELLCFVNFRTPNKIVVLFCTQRCKKNSIRMVFGLCYSSRNPVK